MSTIENKYIVVIYPAQEDPQDQRMQLGATWGWSLERLTLAFKLHQLETTKSVCLKFWKQGESELELTLSCRLDAVVMTEPGLWGLTLCLPQIWYLRSKRESTTHWRELILVHVNITHSTPWWILVVFMVISQWNYITMILLSNSRLWDTNSLITGVYCFTSLVSACIFFEISDCLWDYTF